MEFVPLWLMYLNKVVNSDNAVYEVAWDSAMRRKFIAFNIYNVKQHLL